MSTPPSPLAASPRVEGILTRMSLREKAGQMSQWAFGHAELDITEAAVRQGDVGSFLNAPRDERDRLQRIAIEESRLGVPLIFGRDVIHGYKTIFPIPLALASSFDEGIVEQAATVAAREAAEAGIDWTFAPMVDISRDPRWGRIAESLGEDPYLAARLGAALVRGFQGSDPAAPDRVAACAKHFAGYGASESGKDYNTTNLPERVLRDVYLAPFKACVEAGALTLMCGFNDLDGVPASANDFILRQILKAEWAFGGFVVSDWASMTEMIQHGNCADEREVAEASAKAGVDMEMASRAYIEHLPGLVEQGVVAIEHVDEAVRRILAVKERLGLFDAPYSKPPPTTVALCPEHREAARRAAARSIVLLKNEPHVLPLSANVRDIAVIGSLADDGHEQLGCWAFDGSASDSVTALSALRERVGTQVRVRYAKGLESSRSSEREGFAEAIRVAEQADVILYFAGEPANLSGECRSRAFIDLPGAQAELGERLAALGKPVVLVLMAGRPLTVGALAARCQAVLCAWHLGTMAGPAIADVLLGGLSPSGKLPVSFPRSVGQIPIYYGHKNTGRPARRQSRGIPIGTPLDPTDFDSSYLDVEVSPEYPFGFGLSYTRFEYKDVTVSPARARIGQPIQVRAVVSNVGSVDAEEVVQLYVRDRVGSVTRPVRELKGFQRIALGAGGQQTVVFTLTEQDLAFCGRDRKTRVEPGRFQVFVGGDSSAPLAGEFDLE